VIELTTGQRKRWILVTIALIFVGWVVWSTRGALIPFVIGGVIAYLLAPLVRLIQLSFPQEGRLAAASRPLAILAAYVIAGGLVLAAGLYLIPPLAAQTVSFVESIPTYQEDVQREAAGLVAEYQRLVPETIRTQIETNLGVVGSQITVTLRSMARVTLGAVGTVVGIAAGLALLPLWIFYVLKDERQGMIWFYRLWPKEWHQDVHHIIGIVDSILSAYIRGQLFLGLVIGIVTGIAMWLIGINQSLVLGLFAGVFELIPVLGPWLAFLVAALVTVATSPDRLPLVALAFLAIQQLENTFLVPKVQGDAVRMNPALIMVLLVVGGSLWGVWGMVIIVPIAAILRDVFVYLYGRMDDGQDFNEIPL
jgi:predicted PurR-regulated permease PerM